MLKSKIFRGNSIASFKIVMCFFVALALVIAPAMQVVVRAEELPPQDDPGIEETGSDSGDETPGDEEDSGQAGMTGGGDQGEDEPGDGTGDEEGDSEESSEEGEDQSGNDDDQGEPGDDQGDPPAGGEEEGDGEEGDQGGEPEEVLGEMDDPTGLMAPMQGPACPSCCCPPEEPEEPEDPEVPVNPEVPCGENMILNGDFEYPGVDPSYAWDIFPLNSNLTDWFGNWMPGVPDIYGNYQRPNPANLELQAGVNGWGAYSGDQYAELDSDWNDHETGPNDEPASVTIYQDLSTTDKHYYQVSFYFSPRPETPIEDNRLEFIWGGDVIDVIEEAGGSDVNWTKHEYTVQANGSVTRIQFSDLGNPNSLGTFIDLIEVREICDLTCEDLEGENGWYGEYFNYLASHADMNLPSSLWPDKTHGDPLGAWTTDWYESEYYRFNKIDSNLEFGEGFYPFDFAPEEIHSGHDYHFGAHWSARITVPTAGDYSYTLTSDDDAWVYVDGSLVADNSGIHSPTTINDAVGLTDEHIVDVFFAERHTVRSHMFFGFEDKEITIEPYWELCEPEDEPSPCEVGLLWQIGDVETDMGDNPSDELNWEAPYEFGIFPSFANPFVIGTNTDDEFPWNSNADKSYATDFDVEFDYDSDTTALARLTLSWSPGKTGANHPEQKEIFLDGDSLGVIERVGDPESGWYTQRKVWQDEFEFMLSPGPHTLNLQQYTGDGTMWDYVALEIIDCGGQPEVCVPGAGWADVAEGYNQGPTKGGGSVSSDRSDPDSFLGEPDGVFFSLGQGGTLTASFSGYVLDVEGEDISIHETTYGRASYPEETALVEVSQDGITWYEVGEASNHAGADGITYLDISSTGLPWIKYVRVTDTTDFELHGSAADGFDLDAIDATYEACNYPRLEKTGEFNPETGEITYTITGYLDGTGTAYDPILTDELPAGTSFVSANGIGDYDPITNIVTWDLSGVFAHAPTSHTWTLVVSVDDFTNMDVWADTVVEFNQGLRKDGQPVLLERSDPTKALGEAQNNDTINFVSLGFGGELVLGFDNYIINGDGDDVEIVETSYGDPSETSYPETVEVYASQCGDDWVILGTIVLDGTVDLDLGQLEWARYIKLIDISDPQNFSNGTTVDGFDVDGVRAINSLPELCSIENTAIGRINTEEEGGEIIWVEASTTTTINTWACDDYCTRGGYATGMKFNDVDGDGQKGPNENGLEGWTIYAGKFIESLEVDANGPETGTPIDSSILTNCQKYFLKVTDTFWAGDAITADAKYSVREPNTEWTDIVQNYESWGEALLDLQIDGFSPDWGSYTDTHTYWHTLIGNGSAATFQIYDIYASNNSGTLTVDIYEVVAEDVTDVDGNYWLDLAGVEGEVVIAEQTQTGWVQTAPNPDGYYTVMAEDNSTGLDFGNQEIEEENGGDDPDPDPEPERGLISGMKFNDENGNGEKDQEEIGLEGWVIYLDLNDNGQKDSGEPEQTTDEAGLYAFTELDFGDYIVREEDQSGWSQTFPGFDFDYAYVLTLDVSNPIWSDIDFGNQEGGVNSQGGSTGGGGGGSYYTPEDDSGDGDAGEVAGEQDSGDAVGGGEVLGEQDEGLVSAGPNAWVYFVMSLLLAVFLSAVAKLYYQLSNRRA